ncbi:YbiU family protein [Actinoplanes sp. NPDC049265]|uniref:YbiU family protein n=1 Tax=Actinoplanes sp. NPDC049265 TaxID=3363902 RepID=UPI00371E0897
MAAPTMTLPALPHWEETPADLKAAIREIKVALRARIAASGRTVDEVFTVVERRIRAEVEDIAAARERGETVWPVIEWSDIAAGTVSPEQLALLRRRGCLVVRGHFEREQALGWDRDIVDYVESNRFFENYRGPGDDFFGSVGSKPEIYPIYWSPAQMQARQSDRMATVQAFLNAQWKHESEGGRWFDPGRDSLYPDRIRRRPEGADSNGLGTHLDPGTLDLWMTEAYQRAFRHLFDGTVEEYDPWDAAYRTAGPQYPGSTMCSAFRTFQGWTALSDMAHDQGVLHTVPIPGAMAYLMLRPLLSDVPDDDMCGVTVNQVFPANERWHPLLMEALSGIPDVQAGDSVWWHCDMIHSVAPVRSQRGWGNVMYIPAAPWCPRNEAYAENIRAAFASGESPNDFPPEHYERTWPNRFQAANLSPTARRGLGLQ